MPLFVLLFLGTLTRNINDNIIESFTSPTKYATMVALVLTGIWITIGILMCDVLACTVVLEGNHEYSQDITGRPINLYIVFGTLVSDIVFTIPMLFCIIYICVGNNGRRIFDRLCCNSLFSSCSYCLFNLVVGKNTSKKISKLSENSIISFMFPFMLVTPLLCFSSHLGYIMLAWLTEPSKCTTTILLYYFFFLFLFLSFRRYYKIYSKVTFSCKCCYRKSHNDDTKIETGDHNIKLDVYGKKRNEHKLEDLSAKASFCCLSHSRANPEHINTQAFCLLLFYGVFIVGIALIFVLIFLLLPFSSQEVVIYLFQVFQLIVVLVSIQFASQLFLSDSFSLVNFFQKFKEVYAERGRNKNLSLIASKKDEELADLAGKFAAEFTDYIISAAPADNEKKS